MHRITAQSLFQWIIGSNQVPTKMCVGTISIGMAVLVKMMVVHRNAKPRTLRATETVQQTNQTSKEKKNSLYFLLNTI